ncbi:hypothetical protein C343_02885 [Cryptococcus neoformans C23]|uniref:Phosphoglycerate mutase n=1 Tax=Cryptococcus neoformans (strain H99 / ATCC 208821 / CBS 10515 / FGSC 9487) TaxID=235443 RepID=J9VQA3_CRYN9|nr:hypothetical protein CNAG_01346 [Cryptococcus neoformans var. grubii H99]AUB24511.1 hypothetical protein CKF44_01346 [Cryptococcus neoformans var. grubii]OWZ44100.1 hypothetical protein C343_02885 [Cryptococcus neoformans var. grubii C23]OXC85063.1 hypothetical protein C344_02645 [Cryptococcus neoformans var. grubii AD1-7a]AFR94799.1 hypothetical protein CNAG_01346 [Cryptococcus neoformans var. grubii H99]OXH33860.1 hypothetical protein J005_02732 [Cryptococcus neoformans var. grubii]|eukprot:XP_012049485.1 hypothetical protein CNAG_01346 [Cryptococcus neoformans var. grubii H99]
MRLFFVRHGQTDDNVQGIIQGHKDTPLNDYGRFESTRLAKRLSKYSITEAWSSPLSRAKETTRVMLQYHDKVPLRTPDELKERGLGSMEGRKRRKGERAPADAEDYGSLSRRTKTWFDKLLASHEPESSSSRHDHSSRTRYLQTPLHSNNHTRHGRYNAHNLPVDIDLVLVVTHGAWLSNFVRLLTSPVYHFGVRDGVNLGLPCGNTSIMVVSCEWKDGRWNGVIEDWGNVNHLMDVLGEEVQEVADDVPQ